MRTVSDVNKLTGGSMRAPHHHDAIGLLTPASVTDASYRLYDNISALCKFCKVSGRCIQMTHASRPTLTLPAEKEQPHLCAEQYGKKAPD